MLFRSTLVIIFSGPTTFLKAQLSATLNVTAAAKIGKEISLVETSDLHFGTMARPTGAVNVTVSTTNVRTASVPANITLLPQAPTFHAAAYNVYGGKSDNYIVTIPANNVVNITSGANSMHVNSFTVRTASQGPGPNGHLSNTGLDTFTVGATLQLLSNQPAGTYAGTFNVTVAYN